MGSDIKKFVNPKFLNSIDVVLMRDLFARHFKDDKLPLAFDGDIAEVRKRMADYFATPITDWSEGLIADLHRVAELGTGEGMQLILNEARRRSVILYPEPDAEDAGSAPVKHEAKHVALHAYLHHHQIFEAAADFQALRAPTAMAEFRGPERDVGADLTEEASAAFKAAIVSCSRRICRATTAVSAPMRKMAKSTSSSAMALRSRPRRSWRATASRSSLCAR